MVPVSSLVLRSLVPPVTPVSMVPPVPHVCSLLAESPLSFEAVSSPGSAGRDPPPSPLVDRKKHRRKKLTTPSKTEGSGGQAEGECHSHMSPAPVTHGAVGTRPPSSTAMTPQNSGGSGVLLPLLTPIHAQPRCPRTPLALPLPATFCTIPRASRAPLTLSPFPLSTPAAWTLRSQAQNVEIKKFW